MRMSDEEAADFYSASENQAPAGPGRKRARPGLSEHVPIRFRPDVVEKVRLLAERKGVTVSSWIRHAVEEEIERQMPDQPRTSSASISDEASRDVWGESGSHTEVHDYDDQRVLIEQ